MVVDNYDVMFMTNLVRDHEEIHMFVEHPVDDPILVDEVENIGEDVQPLAVEQDLIVIMMMMVVNMLTMKGMKYLQLLCL